MITQKNRIDMSRYVTKSINKIKSYIQFVIITYSLSHTTSSQFLALIYVLCFRYSFTLVITLSDLVIIGTIFWPIGTAVKLVTFSFFLFPYSKKWLVPFSFFLIQKKVLVTFSFFLIQIFFSGNINSNTKKYC